MELSPVDSIVEQIAALGSELNANQYQIVRLAARYDTSLEWFDQGFKSPASAIARMLGIHTSTAREWIRVGHALEFLPRVDEAFVANNLSYAKTRILTRWADAENEAELLELAHDRSANRLTTAIANFLAGEETDDERDQRHHDDRSVTIHTEADGMVLIRAALPPNIGKHVAEALNTLIRRVAATTIDEPAERSDASTDVSLPQSVVESTTPRSQDASADAPVGATMAQQIRQLKQQWHPGGQGDFWIPTVAQQRADAFVLLFLGKNIDLVTEVVIHVRGDGARFWAFWRQPKGWLTAKPSYDDGTPVTNNAVCQRLDESFVRLMIHDSERRPINASNRRRHPTTRQKRVVLEAHNHECVDCQDTELLEFDHNPPYHETHHTVTSELEPRCGPCHRARHRREANSVHVQPLPRLVCLSRVDRAGH